MLVVDQFRADFLIRLEKKFLPAGTAQNPGGFNYLISQGAYYPLAEYKVLAAMTCPGHAMIMTGAYPAVIGIPLNEWYDRNLKRSIRCVEDDIQNVSPRRLTSSTVGDELKFISKNSKVISVAIKDRSAVMLGGHQADYAFWFGSSGWETSPYYASQVPSWVKNLNDQIIDQKLKNKNKIEVKSILASPLGIEWTMQLALNALENEKLGNDESTDILAMSFSSHDMAGHKYGPFSSEVEAITLAEDREISKMLKVLKKKFGSLDDIVVILTGDHGIPPTVEHSKSSRLASGKIDSLDFYKKVATRLNNKFGKPSAEWIRASHALNYYINPEALSDRKAPKELVEQEIKNEALLLEGVFDVFTSSEFSKGLSIPTFFKNHILNQYNLVLSGDVVIVPQPFFMGKDENTVTHVTGYSYDRYVPVVIFGKNVKPGVYPQSVEIVDLAATLSFILRQLPPAKSSGRILSEIF